MPPITAAALPGVEPAASLQSRSFREPLSMPSSEPADEPSAPCGSCSHFQCGSNFPGHGSLACIWVGTIAALVGPVLVALRWCWRGLYVHGGRAFRLVATTSKPDRRPTGRFCLRRTDRAVPHYQVTNYIHDRGTARVRAHGDSRPPSIRLSEWPH